MMKAKLIEICVIFFIAFISQQKYLPIIRQSQTSSTNPILGANTCTSTGPNNNIQILFGNCFQNVYIIQMSIGSNQQSFNFQFDTGSNILWIPKIGGSITQGFNASQSTTFVGSSVTGSITYADNSQVSGFFGTDLIYVPGTHINVSSSNILFVNNETNMNFPSGVSGLVGMGYTQTPNFLDLAYSANLITSPVFSLQLSLDNQNSYLYYDGGLPSNISKNTIWIQLNGDQYWQVHVIGVFVGGIQYTSDAASSAIIDSGTSYFYVNQGLYNAIQPRFFNDCQTNIFGNIVCPCSSAQNWPTFSFMFQGVQVYINSSQYTVALNSQNCSYNFGVLSTVPNILLGDIFFRGYTISFDKPNAQVGFYGNTSIINLSGRGLFLTSQYVMCGLIFCLGIYGMFVLYYLRQYKRNKGDELGLTSYLNQ